MRLFDPNVVNALEADELRIFYLLEFTIDSVTYRYTDSDIPLIVNGERFEPKSFRLQNISYSTKKIVDQTTLELDNLDQVLTSSFVGGTPQGSEVKISLAILNSGITTILSSDSYYWNFTNGSLEALSGTEPESGYVVTTRENEGPNGSDAIAVEEATTNILSNPGFENAVLTPWFNRNATYNSATINSESYEGDYSCKIVYLQSGGSGSLHDYAISQQVNSTSNNAFTYSVYLKGKAGVKLGLRITRILDSSGYVWSSDWDVTTTVTATGSWQRLVVVNPEYTGSENTTGFQVRAGLYVNSYTPQVGDYCYIDAAQLEEKSFSTSYVNGPRSGGNLRYNDVLNATAGTISFNLYLEEDTVTPTDASRYIFDTNVAWNGAGQLRLTNRIDGLIFLVLYDTAGSGYVKNFTAATYLAKQTWQHWCIVYDQDDKRLDIYIDGTLATDGAATTWTTISIDSDLWIGNYHGVDSQSSNILINNLLILDYDITEGEIAALANENAMPAITIFEGNLGNWWLDEEKISFTVTNQFSQWNQTTLNRHSPSCRWKKFKGIECGYEGSETWCNRTYARCQALDNTANFGGYRWLPSIVDKNVWWGQIPKS